MAKLFQMDAMETELRRLNAENRSLQDRGVLLKLGGAGTPVFCFPTPTSATRKSWYLTNFILTSVFSKLMKCHDDILCICRSFCWWWKDFLWHVVNGPWLILIVYCAVLLKKHLACCGGVEEVKSDLRNVHVLDWYFVRACEWLKDGRIRH